MYFFREAEKRPTEALSGWQKKAFYKKACNKQQD